MARTSNNGTAQSVSTQDFNERVKRIFDTKPDPSERPVRQPSPARFKRPAPPTTGS